MLEQGKLELQNLDTKKLLFAESENAMILASEVVNHLSENMDDHIFQEYLNKTKKPYSVEHLLGSMTHTVSS